MAGKDEAGKHEASKDEAGKRAAGKDERGHSDPARVNDQDDGYTYPGKRTPPGHVPDSVHDDPGTGLSDEERRKGIAEDTRRRD